ncbi:hypothetical protein L7F22_030371 [Adiantum nelumboides]|nr:hypothetical protein [Adiantum nelumboides]
MADNNKENRMSIDDFDFAHEDANDDTSMLVNYLVTRLHQAMGNPALQGEVQQQLHAYGILPPIQQERGPERFQGETSKRGLSTEKGVENLYQELKQLLEGKPSSKKKGHVQHERSPSREREESESSDESMEDVAPRRRRAQRSPTPTKRKRSPHTPRQEEIQKLVERLINYFIFKGLFLALIAQPDVMQITLWLVWFSVLGFLKVFQGLAKDRLERLNASPTATMFAHGRVFAVLVLVLMFSLFWIQLCVFMFKDTGINTLLLLLFEPLSMAFDTLQAVVIHGVQLYDTWHRHTVDEVPKTKQARPSERYAAAAAWEWRGSLLQNFGFAMDVVSYLLALSHCLHIWWLRGLAFKLVDGVLFLNLRALLSAILKRIKGFMKVKTAMSTLQCALPDATEEELLAYDDDCAICKEPMGKAKQLPCAHLFHLPCLRSWLDQGLAEAYSCPTCRRPLFMGSGKNSLESRQHFSGGNPTRRGGESTGYPAATETQVLSTFTPRTASSTRVHDPFTTPHWDSAFPNTWSETEAWADSFHVAAASENNGSSSGAGTLGSGRMETVMQHLTGSPISHSQHESSSSSSWGWWPFSHGMGGSSQVGAGAVDQHTSQLIHQTVGLGNRSQDFAGPSRLRAMVDTVREVLPNVSEEIIVQDLQRTNSVTTTVNNLL